MNLSKKLLFASLLVGLSACGWVDRDMNMLAVWSDDDSAQAYVRGQWEEKQKAYPYPAGGAQRRNYRHHLYVQNADGTGHRRLYGAKAGVGGTELFYAKTRGYLIVSVVEEDSPFVRFDRVDAATGAAITVIRSNAPRQACGTVDVVPSPDAATLAVIERTGQDYPSDSSAVSPGALCGGGTVTVRFVDADDLAEQARYSWSVDNEVEYTWNPAGELFVGTYQTMWRVDPSRGPALATRPGCMQPRTTTSNVSAAGALIAPNNDADSNAPIVQVIDEVPESQRFGCQ